MVMKSSPSVSSYSSRVGAFQTITLVAREEIGIGRCGPTLNPLE
jgi:hypothetical protein